MLKWGQMGEVRCGRLEGERAADGSDDGLPE